MPSVPFPMCKFLVSNFQLPVLTTGRQLGRKVQHFRALDIKTRSFRTSNGTAELFPHSSKPLSRQSTGGWVSSYLRTRRLGHEALRFERALGARIGPQSDRYPLLLSERKDDQSSPQRGAPVATSFHPRHCSRCSWCC